MISGSEMDEKQNPDKNIADKNNNCYLLYNLQNTIMDINH